jgi:octaprenyl-diphosphate synthase
MLGEIKAPVLRELEAVEAEFRTLVKSDVPIINDVIDHIAVFKGKRLRPILLLLCSGMTGGISEDSIKAAAMVELLHTATLVHDDVIDGSDLRRGGPSVNAVWGNKVSILIGDLFFSRVLDRLAEIEDPAVTHMMSVTIKSVCEGELVQWRNGYYHSLIDEDVYFDLITSKTASLLAVSCELGAISSNAKSDNGDRPRLKRFGEHLGIAFQIKDDMMDFNGSRESVGKPVSNDLIENTMTLPLLYGLRNSKNGDSEKIAAMLRRGVGAKDLDAIHRFVEESGGIAYAQDKAKYHTNMALSCLDNYDDTPYKRSLLKLTRFIVERNY